MIASWLSKSTINMGRSKTRYANIKLTKVQTLILKSAIASVPVVEVHSKVKDQIRKDILDTPSLVRQLSQGIALSACANYELNMKAIKPNIYQEYKHLCFSTVPVTDSLFGRDLCQHLKDMAEANRVASTLI